MTRRKRYLVLSMHEEDHRLSDVGVSVVNATTREMTKITGALDRLTRFGQLYEVIPMPRCWPAQTYLKDVVAEADDVEGELE